MGPGIVIPIVVLPLALLGAYVWYRRSIAALRPGNAATVSGTRLTAESLHRLGSPWRVVYEISGALGAVDHVAIGPPGVVVVTTVVADRPRPQTLIEVSGEARLVGDAAIALGPVDDLLRSTGARSHMAARVFWGTPDTDRPAFEQVVHGLQVVEGQRLESWLADISTSATDPYDPARIDLAWQSITRGIGRPDPLR